MYGLAELRTMTLSPANERIGPEGSHCTTVKRSATSNVLHEWRTGKVLDCLTAARAGTAAALGSLQQEVGVGVAYCNVCRALSVLGRERSGAVV